MYVLQPGVIRNFSYTPQSNNRLPIQRSILYKFDVTTGVSTTLKYWKRQKPVIPGGRKEVRLDEKSNTHPTSPVIGPKRIVPGFGRLSLVQSALYLVLAGYSPGTPDLVYLACLPTVFCVLLANHRPSNVPPYSPYTNTDVRGDRLHTPNHATRAAHMYSSNPLPRHGDIDIQMPICTMARDSSSASAASEIEVGAIYPTMQALLARRPRSRQTRVLLVWRGVECGGGRGAPRTSVFL